MTNEIGFAEDAVSVMDNVRRLHEMAFGELSARKFHRIRVRNALHQVVTIIDEQCAFAPVKWSCNKQATLDNYLEVKEPYTKFFISAAKELGFNAVPPGSERWDALYDEYVAYCSMFGFTHSDTEEQRTFYVREDEVHYPDEISEDAQYVEGALKTVLVNAFERSATARAACIAHYGHDCIVCGFNFEKRYGSLGTRYIHVHHLVPLHEIRGEYVVNPVQDLVPVCPNCHAMLHRDGRKDVDQLRVLLQ